jgi:hypothetical protein
MQTYFQGHHWRSNGQRWFVLVIIYLTVIELLVCERCRILVTREEKQRRFKEKLKQLQDFYAPFVAIYSALVPLRKEITRSFANYEHLAVSLYDGTVSKKAENFSTIYEVS